MIIAPAPWSVNGKTVKADLFKGKRLTITRVDNPRFTPECNANHRQLIAAAPELLKELEQAHAIIHALWEMGCKHAIPDSEWPYLHQSSRLQVIRKAKGETP